MPNLKRLTLLLFLSSNLALAPHAQAQHSALPTPQDAINVIEGLLRDVCDMTSFSVFGFGAGNVADLFGAGEALDSLMFMCDYQGVLQRATRAVTNLFEAVDDTTRQRAASAYNDIHARFTRTPFSPGVSTPSARNIEQDLTVLLEEIRTGIATGDDTAPTIEDYRTLARQYLTDEADNARAYFQSLASNPQAFPDGSGMRAFAQALSLNPMVEALTFGAIEESLTLALERVDTETAFQSGALSAETFLDTSDYQQSVVRALDPADGTAVTLAERATAATSTRESINELARGWADYMRQDAVFSGTIIEGLKQLVRQQTVTNEALRVEAVARIDERQREIDAQQAALAGEMLSVHSDVVAFMGSLIFTSETVDNILGAGEYPPDFCARFYCPPGQTPSP